MTATVVELVNTFSTCSRLSKLHKFIGPGTLQCTEQHATSSASIKNASSHVVVASAEVAEVENHGGRRLEQEDTENIKILVIHLIQVRHL